MPRRFKPRQRLSGVRDAKLIIIASEGVKTEPKYFRCLASQYINSKIKVYHLERDDVTASSPKKIIRSLDKFRDDYSDLEDKDEFWLVIDVDRWRDAKLSEIAQKCHQKNYRLAVSNPCFELWLLLHLKSLDEYSEDVLEEFRQNLKDGYRTRLGKELVEILGEYNKSNLNPDQFLPFVEQAIQRARRLDINPNERWPNDLGSRVYLLAEKIIDL
ncbi:MAG: RloB family protein [Chloroflexota bacterium]|nr:RloB family protein [Chloroflexota bacterium]